MAGKGGIDRDLVRKLAREALEEDLAWDDAASGLLPAERLRISADIIVRECGITAGLAIAEAVFKERDEKINFTAHVKDGTRVKPGTRLARVQGIARSILSAERAALNFVQHLSGIATLTAAFVSSVQGKGIRILDTRKTTPLLRALEKYAVRVGGGFNHRFNLKEMAMIKDNHIRAMGDMDATLQALSSAQVDCPVEVEIDSLESLEKVLDSRIDRVMLDNFSPEEVVQALDLVDAYCKSRSLAKPEIEVSGGITLGNVSAYAIEGVDYISIGAITHSAPALNVSLEIEDKS